ncbi:hypothetical protein L1987_22307 [Smallanthus sonchifolius]|uniref:Uncharacterized protein n=1 Tax=Smallanthus sonchifolius TaxID=185202 RepID=A0ACB9IF20_9ASTR|nr:hypothetical protein L1987_22307 [Smallanthus sonchifolius]
MKRTLPPDVWRTVIDKGIANSNFNHVDLCNLSIASKTTNIATDDDLVWSKLFYRKFGDETGHTKTDYRRRFKREARTLKWANHRQKRIKQIQHCNEILEKARTRLQRWESIKRGSDALKYHKWMTYNVRAWNESLNSKSVKETFGLISQKIAEASQLQLIIERAKAWVLLRQSIVMDISKKIEYIVLVQTVVNSLHLLSRLKGHMMP